MVENLLKHRRVQKERTLGRHTKKMICQTFCTTFDYLLESLTTKDQTFTSSLTGRWMTWKITPFVECRGRRNKSNKPNPRMAQTQKIRQKIRILEKVKTFNQGSNNMNKKIILTIIILSAILISGCVQPRGKCGDGICGPAEQDNPSVCPEDCKTTCQENWECAQWSDCVGDEQTRTCTDLNDCGTATNKPSESRGCTEPVRDFEDSPFAIYSPYETFLDHPNPGIMSGINDNLVDLGVKWVQEPPIRLNFLESAKDYVQIYSMALPQIGLPRCGKISSYDKYKATLRETIGKYAEIKYWQADTEPEHLAWGNCPEEYAEFLKVTYHVIKEECSDCKVVFGGIGGDFAILDENSAKVKFLRNVLEAGGAGYFDVFEFKQNFHTVDEYPALIKNKMEVYGKVLSEYNIDIKKIPVFLETAMYDGNPEDKFHKFPPQTEREQAAGVISTYVYALSQGIDKILWMFVVERGPGVFIYSHYGLIHNPDNDGLAHKKLAYYTYKLMAEKLGGSDWDNTETIQGKEGIYVYKFTKNNKPVWVAWNDNPTPQQIIISNVNANQVKITEAVPKYDSGKEVTDYETAFETEIKTVSNRKITINLGESPIFVEEK
jgi:hypothetical protein